MTRPAAVAYDDNLVRAWARACEQIVSGKTVEYVLVTSFGTGWLGSNAERMALDSAAKGIGAETPSSVASMLLPKIVREADRTTAEAIELGQRVMGRGRRRGLRFSGWRHTYFERLTGAWYDRTGVKEEICQNRLLKAINKLNEWGRNAEAVFYIHTNLESDAFRPRGSPCLQYVQLRAYGDSLLSIVGLYRSHDYTNKALGNFVGLNDLGRFVAGATGRVFTGADVISLHPFVGTRSQINEYIAEV